MVKRPVRQQHAGGTRVLRRVRIARRLPLTERVRLTAAVDRGLDHVARGRDDLDTHAVDRDRVAGLHDRALAFGDGEIVLESSLDAGILRVRRIRIAVIEEAVEVRDGIRRRRAADMIPVVVRREEVVDLRQAGRAHRRRNPRRVTFARRGRRTAGIDQQRLSGGRHDQRGAAAFDVDLINAEGIGRADRTGGQQRGQHEDQRRSHATPDRRLCRRRPCGRSGCP